MRSQDNITSIRYIFECLFDSYSALRRPTTAKCRWRAHASGIARLRPKWTSGMDIGEALRDVKRDAPVLQSMQEAITAVQDCLMDIKTQMHGWSMLPKMEAFLRQKEINRDIERNHGKISGCLTRFETPWDISKDFPYPRVLEYDVQEGTWLRLDVHPVTGDIIFWYASDAVAVSHPVLTGVPYDSDPHFSPEGDRIVFRSDAGLGLGNIWVTAWKGCTEMNVETTRDSAQRITNETYRFMSDARFHPSGDKVVVTKWFTSSRSIGAGDGWEFPIPALGSNTPVSAGTGTRLLERTLPAGFDDYGEEQIGPEQSLWHGDDSLQHPRQYIQLDVHNGIYSIFERDLTTLQTVTLVDAFPGGASRPELSRDGHLVTGTIHYIWDGLSYDVTVIYAPMGTYPSFAFSPDDSAVIIWAAGQIWSVPLSENEFGAHIKKYLGKLRTIDDIDLVGIETADTQRRAFKDLRADASGKRVVFQAAGETFVQVVGAKKPTKVPVLYDSIAKMVDMGLKTFIGAHGEPPLLRDVLCSGWSTRQPPRMPPRRWVFSSLGSLSAGKLADFVVFEAGADVLGGRMPESLKIVYVARGGRIWEAETMAELWPVKGRKQAMPPFNP
ncbi:hypothetical protein BDZ89DRAFT_1130161 [Hymenopellis radicata]|nr:hypothetical protein BDZ89DRAFT_1130161 [Hymenopellis radicata]